MEVTPCEITCLFPNDLCLQHNNGLSDIHFVEDRKIINHKESRRVLGTDFLFYANNEKQLLKSTIKNRRLYLKEFKASYKNVQCTFVPNCPPILSFMRDRFSHRSS